MVMSFSSSILLPSLYFASGELAKHTFSSLEIFLIFLLVMMIVITVALLSLLFITNGTIKNHKDSGDHGLLTTQDPIDIQTTPVISTPEPPLFQNFSGYHIGVGRADCTGQVSDILLMGYSKSGQYVQGLLTRLYSWAFIVAEPLAMVLSRLKSKYGSLHRRDNGILSATYPHSGPAGYFQYTLFLILSEGFSNRTFEYWYCEGTTEGDPFWDIIQALVLGIPSNELKECHKPKPILFHTGEISIPHPWYPDIVDVQIITLGFLAIAALPGEFTTMSGLRLREAVQAGEVAVVVFVGANPKNSAERAASFENYCPPDSEAVNMKPKA
ncbi:PREDICTED: neutral ceramidase-like [Dipodomys ordii]|uniref:Neutral ceramidase n=1 Tax=Dipodomys ordii TaxID=10020 RepID=A0A1S3F9G6_DIPOR|nr:PREDICTED: neutral ceramidase-like [Dipodomys ordii]